MTSLLERAKAVARKGQKMKPVSAEEVDLFYAWLNGEVGTAVASEALGLQSSTGFYVWAARVMRTQVVSRPEGDR